MTTDTAEAGMKLARVIAPLLEIALGIFAQLHPTPTHGFRPLAPFSSSWACSSYS